MFHTARARRLRRAVLVAGAACAAAGVTACGSASSSSSGGSTGGGDPSPSQSVVSQARQVVGQARQPVTSYTLPQAHLSAVKDKHIVAITCTNQGSGCLQSAQAAAAAVKSFGWTMTIVDGKGDPNVWNSAILNAITDHADAILLSAVPTALVSDAMAKAKAAGIPIVTMFTPVLPDGAFGHVTVDHTLQGKQMADWVIAQSHGKAHVIVNTDTEFTELRQRVTGFETELAKCGGCKVVATVPSTLATLATELPNAAASAAQAHPDADYFIAVTDNHAVFAVQGLRQAGVLNNPVKVASYDGNTPNYQLLRDGSQAADDVEPYGLQGWLAADLLLRALDHQPAADRTLPSRMLDKQNVPSSGMWDTDFKYQTTLRSLWGAH